MANLVPKTPRATWIATARAALVEEGVAGVKVDRLAQRLGVTKGGFYKQFPDRADLLARLLDDWERSNRFMPPMPRVLDRAQAMGLLAALPERLIVADDFDPRFDMAVREWGRVDPVVARRVQKVDRQRLADLQRLFAALGCEAPEAEVRARILYYHQIGYYALGVNERRAVRRRLTPTYLRILTGVDGLAG